MILALLLGCGTTVPSEPPPRQLPALDAPLIAQRAALESAEAPRLKALFDTAMEQGDLRAAAELVVEQQRRSGTAEPQLSALSVALEQSPDLLTSAQAASILFEGARDAPARAHWKHVALSRLARWRYTPAERAKTLAEQQGVTLAIAAKALHTLQDDYVEPVPTEQLLRAGAERLAELGWLERVPNLPDDLDAGLALLAEQCQGAPMESVLAELTEAAFDSCDPHSMPIWPAQVSSWQDHHEGVAQGVVGVIIDTDADGIFVRQLVEDGPAWLGGVHVGDRLLTLDGEVPRSLDDAAARLRGPNQTPVVLGLVRDGKPLTAILTRTSLRERTVSAWERNGPGWSVWAAPRIAYLRIQRFKPETAKTFQNLLPSRQSLDGLVLDLRGNAGGELSEALLIADVFLADGPIFQIEGRHLPEREAGWGHAIANSPWEGLPLAVLVDHRTASSAEILAGALQSKGAVVIGSRTVGKGTVQSLRTDTELGFALQFTHARWLLADGRPLQRTDSGSTWGLTPDVVDITGPTERFIVGVLQARREALPVHADGSPLPYTGVEIDETLPPFPVDPQVLLAIRALTPPGAVSP